LSQLLEQQSQIRRILLAEKKTAHGHTHGLFVPPLMGIWLIEARILLSKLYWIPVRIVKRNGLVLQKPSHFHAQTFLERGRRPLQWKALYMAEKKLEVVR
jgi:hypothetical protein